MADVHSRSEGTLLALLEALDEGALVFDEASICRRASRRFADLFGLEPAVMTGTPRAELLARIAGSLRAGDALEALGGDAPSSGRTVVDPIEVERPHARTVVWTSVPIASGGRLDLVRDVTRERRAERATAELVERLEMVSTIDDLTGLVNRRRFEEECQREHRRAQREWISYAVARVDVDGMARVNEKHGRPTGDELLRCIGEELRASRREYDVVARWMNDEFIVLLPRAEAAPAFQVIRRALARVTEKGQELVPGLTVSVGIAIWSPPSADGAADTIRRAGEALAAAKVRGPGKVEMDTGAAEWRDASSEG